MDSAPLLEFSAGESDEQGRRKEGWLWKLVDVDEMKHQLLFSFPMILTNMAYYAITLVSVMFAGHLGDTELAGATLGNSWSSVTGIALVTGLSGALETFCGQGFGAKLYRMLGVYLQSSIVTISFFSIIISVLWYFSEEVLIWLHQEPNVAKMAAIYVRYLIPGIFAYGFIQCILRFLQTQSVVVPLVICSAVPLAVHVGLTHLLVHVIGLGFKGASLSASISLWISFLMLVLYIKFSVKFKETWQGLSKESFHYILPSMKLAVPSAMMVCLEYWAFEILVLLAALLPDSESSTSLIAMCVNTEVIAFMITYGLSAAVSTRVSNEMGAGNIEQAKKAVSVTLKLAVLLALIFVLLLAFGHNIWAYGFSSNPEIVRKFAYMTPFLAASIVLDSAQGILSGVSRGCGLQHKAAWTNLVTFYIIGLPLVLLFGFKLGLYDKGLWLGLICGLFCQACTLLVIINRINWSRIGVQVVDKEDQQHV
ncbi:protein DETOXIFICATION 19 [Dendrobium catenatum]|uniref:Protein DETOXIFICATION n=1 Tax=Dendrobium catenatum TaxID=906689 RepID=A0A2I0WJS7_9ASPA|nr:protein DETOXIFICATION 19 [Dendrobium catenatum]PKU75909.1 MATE efflux family protein ALF5 [Dendrobium catenatum]